MKLCSLQFFYLNSYWHGQTKFESLKFEIQISWMALNGETPTMEVVDLRKLWNFVVDKFLIWICLEPKKPIYTRCIV
jgi:hypothetical protein